MEVPWQLIAIGCAAALAALGIAVTLFPRLVKSGLWKALVVVSFVMLAVGYGFAESQSSSETAAIQKKILEGTTGGDNFGYIKAALVPSENETFRLMFNTPGNLFGVKWYISPWSVGGDVSKKEYYGGGYGDMGDVTRANM